MAEFHLKNEGHTSYIAWQATEWPVANQEKLNEWNVSKWNIGYWNYP